LAAASRRPRARFLLLLLVLAGVTLITLSDRASTAHYFAKARSIAQEVASPVQSAVHSVLRPVGDFIYGALHYHAAEVQIRDLQQQVAALQTAPVVAAAEEAEAQQVLGLEHIKYLSDIPSVAAQVVQLGSANFEETVEIDRGSDDGVAVGEPVVSAGGLVGSVSAVSGHLATVTLLDDPSFTVGVRDVRSGVVGAALGQGAGNTLEVEDINVGADVHRGDYMVTSGLSLEHFPAGIPVGTVESVDAPSGALQLVASLKPFASLANLQFVKVLLWSPQG
jgi:rod shape-determining protein MreC